MADAYKRILLVEDNPNDSELTLTALKEYNLANEVIVADDGEEALDYLKYRGKFAMRLKGNPVVIFLDIKLVKINGLEILKQIKTDDSLKLIPVVILTSSKEQADIGESYKLGANAYVVKPVDFHEFINAVKKMGIFWALVNEPPLRSR